MTGRTDRLGSGGAGLGSGVDRVGPSLKPIRN